jgi:hypothetical protein
VVAHSASDAVKSGGKQADKKIAEASEAIARLVKS